MKTRVYIGNDVCNDLIKCLHPPIDNELWKGIRIEYGSDEKIISKTNIVEKIKDIRNYSIYETIIEGCRLISKKRNCYLIEVEELWQGNRI